MVETVRITLKPQPACPLARKEDYDKLAFKGDVIFEYLQNNKPTYFVKHGGDWFFWTA